MNLTEPNAGSDLAQVRTKAVDNGDGTYSITGQKIFSSPGVSTTWPIISSIWCWPVCRTPGGVKGISLFIVPKYLVNADGTLGARNDARCVSIEHKLGITAAPLR